MYAINGALIIDANVFGVGRLKPVRLSQVSDGMSNTFAVGEMAWLEGFNWGAWPRSTSGGSGTWLSYCCRNVAYPIHEFRYDPSVSFDYNDISFGSEHPGGCHFLMLDGSTHFFSEDTELVVLQAFATRDGGEVNSLGL